MYDISAKKPVKVVYDFHHNLRAESFTDTSRVQRDGLHVLTYHDAGGHRVLWDSGETPSLGDLLLLSRRWTLADVYEEYPSRDVLGGDKIFGTMIEYLKRKGEIANWRNANQDWNEGATLKVEAFSHWVWVYGVESTLVNDPQNIESFGWKQKVVKVSFTETNFATPLYTAPYREMWPAGLYDAQGNVKLLSYLPWMVTYSGVDDNNDSVIDWYRSSTRAVWEWKSYSPTDLQSPISWTKYYDGSPNKNP
ncbi:MAG: hypothetical protein ACPL1Y_06325 [Thermoplasmata archaeon]